MSHTTKKLDNSQLELTITVEAKNYQKHLEKAAQRMSERSAVKGFRPGKVPYDVMKKEVGDMKILEEAMGEIVQEAYYDIIIGEKIEAIGMPEIKVEKMAPGNDLVFKATVALLPTVKLPDLTKIKIKKHTPAVGEKEMEETLNAIRGMHAKEVVKAGQAEGTDKLVLDMEMFIDKVAVEGGQARDYQVYLSENHYIPGFNEQVAGLKKDEEKEFKLTFPAEHYQKHLAGKQVDFKVKIKEVYDRQLPELSDDLAKTLGQESIAKMKELIHNNLLQEAEHKAYQKFEIELLDTMIDQAEFEPIPEVLINAERQKIFYELKHNLEQHNIPIEKYLEDLKKTEEELMRDYRTEAERRAKAALLSRQVAKENGITADETEIDAEVKMMKDVYKDNKEYLEKLDRPEIRETIAVTIQNKKVMKWLGDKVTEEEKK